MTSFWNRPVWYVALLRCVAGGIVGTAVLLVGFAVVSALGEVIMRFAPLDNNGVEAQPDPFEAFLSIPFLLVFIVGCILLAVQGGKWSAAIVYRGQGRARFVPKYALTLLFAYLSIVLLSESGVMELIYNGWVKLLALNDREKEGFVGTMVMYFVGYLPTYVISLYVYRCVELARKAPTEES